MDDAVSILSKPTKRSSCMNAEVPGSDPFLHDRLIEAVAQHRDREAFACLFQHFAPRLKSWLMKAGATATVAEDFAQDTLLTVWRKADLFDSRKARAATWIFTIARNRRLDALRRDARALPVPELELTSGEEPQRPDDILSGFQDAVRVREAMATLPPEQVEVLRMAYYLENPHSEIAQRLGLPLGTVKSRIRNAMIKLRHLLETTEEAAK